MASSQLLKLLCLVWMLKATLKTSYPIREKIIEIFDYPNNPKIALDPSSNPKPSRFVLSAAFVICFTMPASDRGLTVTKPMTDEVIADVLFVDLDGTLVATDVLREALVLAVKHRPWVALLFLLGVLRGRAAAKRAVAKRLIPEPEQLPFREEVIHFIVETRACGRRVVLATASDAIWAAAIARHVGCFDDILASDGQRNLKGTGKLKAIQTYCQQYGFASFAYIGDAMADLPIWQHASQVYVVSPSLKLLDTLHRQCPPTRIFGQGEIE